MIDKAPKKVEKGRFPEVEPSINQISIPVEILSDRSVATLEAVTEYMFDVLHLSYHEIALLLKRDDRTIWTCYHRAKSKRNKNSLNSNEEINPNKKRKDG